MTSGMSVLSFRDFRVSAGDDICVAQKKKRRARVKAGTMQRLRAAVSPAQSGLRLTSGGGKLPTWATTGAVPRSRIAQQGLRGCADARRDVRADRRVAKFGRAASAIAAIGPARSHCRAMPKDWPAPALPAGGMPRIGVVLRIRDRAKRPPVQTRIRLKTRRVFGQVQRNSPAVVHIGAVSDSAAIHHGRQYLCATATGDAKFIERGQAVGCVGQGSANMARAILRWGFVVDGAGRSRGSSAVSSDRDSCQSDQTPPETPHRARHSAPMIRFRSGHHGTDAAAAG